MRLEDKEMSNDELNVLSDETLVKMAKDGSDYAEEFLIEKYKETVKNKAKAYYIEGADREDVVQEGMIGIFKAIKSFNEKKDTSFRTFAGLCINRQIITAIKRANRQKHQPLNDSVSLYQKTDNDDCKNNILGTLCSGDDTNPETLLLMGEIVNYLKESENGVFSSFENDVLAEKLKGRDYKEIAESLGKKPKVIDNALQRIKKKIARYLND